jgi:hypothetical protein
MARILGLSQPPSRIVMSHIMKVLCGPDFPATRSGWGLEQSPWNVPLTGVVSGLVYGDRLSNRKVTLSPERWRPPSDSRYQCQVFYSK